MEKKWKRNGKLIQEPIIEYLEKIFDEELANGFKLRVCVGTDSQKITKGKYDFATVVLITTTEVAYEIAPLLDLYDIPLEIHADINPNPIHDSNKALQSAVGYILGMGYEFKVKPDAQAASHCADNLL